MRPQLVSTPNICQEDEEEEDDEDDHPTDETAMTLGVRGVWLGIGSRDNGTATSIKFFLFNFLIIFEPLHL
jgi:hypothetical protein